MATPTDKLDRDVPLRCTLQLCYIDAFVLSEINSVHCVLKRSKIGKYEILSKTATGVIEDVYKARDTETGRPGILKTINVDPVADPGIFERLYQKARFAASLQLDGP